MTANPHNVVLEPAAQALIREHRRPDLFDLVPDKARNNTRKRFDSPTVTAQS